MNNYMSIRRFAEIMDTDIPTVITLVGESKIPTIEIDGITRIEDMSTDEAMEIQRILSRN